MLVFEEGGKPEFPEKNLTEQSRETKQTQPTYDAGSGNRTREHIGGRRELSPLGPTLLPEGCVLQLFLAGMSDFIFCATTTQSECVVFICATFNRPAQNVKQMLTAKRYAFLCETRLTSKFLICFWSFYQFSAQNNFANA